MLLQMSGKEAFHGTIEVKAVLLIAEAMPLVVFDHVFYVNTSSLKRCNHLVAFGFVDTWVVGSLSNKQRDTDAVGVQSRRCCFKHVMVGFRVANLFV